MTMNRCPRCDRPTPTDDDWRTPPGERPDLCWDGFACEPVDWRARYLALREAAIVYAFGDEARAEDIAGTPCGAPDGDACETCALLRALGVAPGGDDR